MHRLSLAAAAAVVVLSSQARVAAADELTLDQALALARERAPLLAAARLGIDEARGRLVGASVLLRDNPEVAAGIGPSSGPDRRQLDLDLGVSQSFETGGRRAARMAGARAGVERATAGAADVARRLLRDVGAAFLRALQADERVRLAEAAERLAAEIVASAERRHRAGDVPVLHVNIARTTQARARAETQGAQAARAVALGELRVLLGWEPARPLVVRGDLRDRRRFEALGPPQPTEERPDVRAVMAEVRGAQADLRLGRARAWPELGVGVQYLRQEGANVLLGTFSVRVPLFERGQGARAEARARLIRTRLELAAARQRVSSEVQAALAAYRLRVAAVKELEERALPLLEQNETLSRRSYDLGQLGLGELLLFRRELLETRLEHLNRLLEAAVAGVELEAVLGGSR